MDGSIICPESAHKSSLFQVLYGEEFDEISQSTNGVFDSLCQIFSKIEQWVNNNNNNNDDDGDDVADEENDVIYMSDEGGDDLDEFTDNHYYNNKQVLSVLESDLKHVSSVKGWYGELGSSGKQHIKLHLLIDPAKKSLKDMTRDVAECWGVDLDRYIGVTVTFYTHFTEQERIPTVNVYQIGDNKKKPSSSVFLEEKKTFGLYWTLEQRMKSEFFPKYWPFGDKLLKLVPKVNFIQQVLEDLEYQILHCNKRCLICGNQLPYEGLKPAVCENNLCIFSRENYGLGVDLISELQNNAEIVDILITLTAAAAGNRASNTYNPFDPFPTIEVKMRDETLSFLNNDDKDNDKVHRCIERMPPVNTLQQYANKGGEKLIRAKLDEIDPLMYPLLRWIISSMRSHLKKLEKHEMMSQFNTNYQYKLMSASPEKEKNFQQLKKQYRSFHAFHGSSLCNWHSIMRTGLKNMSGKAGQVNGAAYGSGVYCASNSSTSFSYMRYTSGWSNSSFGRTNLGCLAMVEIIDKPGIKKVPYYVIENENLLMTRYFFFYAGHGSATVEGSSIPVPK
jgi:poly [ADP-ribose] polymerase 6/8